MAAADHHHPAPTPGAKLAEHFLQLLAIVDQVGAALDRVPADRRRRRRRPCGRAVRGRRAGASAAGEPAVVTGGRPSLNDR
jgi:hypothetical protein